MERRLSKLMRHSGIEMLAFALPSSSVLQVKLSKRLHTAAAHILQTGAKTVGRQYLVLPCAARPLGCPGTPAWKYRLSAATADSPRTFP